MDAWIESHAGWAFNHTGRVLVPKYVDHDKIEKRQQGASPFSTTTKAFDPEAKLYIAGVANENSTDRMDEVLDPTGIKIENFVRNSVLLLQHSHNDPIGQVPLIKIESSGVHFEAWIGDPKNGPLTPEQNKARSLVWQGILKACSVGFIPLKIRMPAFNDMGDMVDPAVIEQWELLEHSIVSVPCNAGSLFEAKGKKTDKFKFQLPKVGEDGRFIIAKTLDEKRRSFPRLGKDGKFRIYGT